MRQTEDTCFCLQTGWVLGFRLVPSFRQWPKWQILKATHANPSCMLKGIRHKDFTAPDLPETVKESKSRLGTAPEFRLLRLIICFVPVSRITYLPVNPRNSKIIHKYPTCKGGHVCVVFKMRKISS